jgi:hypothetical protein
MIIFFYSSSFSSSSSSLLLALIVFIVRIHAYESVRTGIDSILYRAEYFCSEYVNDWMSYYTDMFNLLDRCSL